MHKGINFILAILLAVVLVIPIIIIALLIRFTSNGSAVHWSNRIGKDNKTFQMPKFRTMKLETPDVATHLLQDPGRYLTPLGGFLRKTSLDELPQLWSVLKGDMVFVGPRPALFNQDDLIALRTKSAVHKLVPGITGWAQIQGRDAFSISKKVEMDIYYAQHRSLRFDLKIILLTIFAVFKSKGISH